MFKAFVCAYHNKKWVKLKVSQSAKHMQKHIFKAWGNRRKWRRCFKTMVNIEQEIFQLDVDEWIIGKTEL